MIISVLKSLQILTLCEYRVQAHEELSSLALLRLHLRRDEVFSSPFLFPLSHTPTPSLAMHHALCVTLHRLSEPTRTINIAPLSISVHIDQRARG